MNGRGRCPAGLEKHGEDVGRKAARGSVWTGLSSYAVFAISFATGIVLARAIDPAVFGVFAFATAIVGLIRIIGGIGYPDFLIRRGELEAGTVGTVFSVSLLLGAGVIVLWVAVSPLLYFFAAPELVWLTGILALVAAAGFAAEVPLALMQRTFALKSIAVIQLVSGVVVCATSLLIVFLGGGIAALVVQGAGTTLLSGALYFAVTPERIGLRWDRAVVRELFHKGKSFFGSGIVMTMSRQLDKLMIGAFLTDAQLGFYNRAQRMSGLFSVVVPTAVTRTVLPTYSAVKGDRGKLIFTYDLLMSMHLLLLGPLGVGLIFGGEALIELLYGAKWVPSAPAFRIFVLVLVLTPLVGIGNLLHIALNHPERMARASLAAFTVFLPALWVGLSRWGIVGAAGAVALFEIAGFTVVTAYTAAVLGTRVTLRPLLPHVACVLVSVPLLSWMTHVLGGRGLGLVAELAVVGIATIVIYGGVLALLDRKRVAASIGYVLEKLGVSRGRPMKA
ncbi:MAG: oligosaccharide flippase family protein [Verrucomicrobiales bacterium]